jgi:large subunit ribosomal protein L4e
MELQILKGKNKSAGKRAMPIQFSESYHPNLIKRAVHALESAKRQRYGASPEAGLRHSSKLSKRRRKYRGCYGFGISRVNRKIHTRRGTRFFWVGTFSPQTRGGRRSHAPKATKVLLKKINKKENRKAICSAMAATLNRELVKERGHKIPEAYPFIMSSDIETLSKTIDVKKLLIDLGFEDELMRSAVKKVRAGKGKSRGRKYQKRKGLLLVTAEDCPLTKSAKNIPGIDIVAVNSLNAKLLAPGSQAGRITLFTESAMNLLEEKRLFI